MSRLLAGRREELHATALRVLDDYETRGMPFALYLRHFGATVIHGPMELSPQLIENALEAALPEGVRVLTIQEHGANNTYMGNRTSFDRNAPALFLPNEHWQEVPHELIRHAELIVSECPILSGGVRFELEVASRESRWDRTVLVLPPLSGPFPVVDSDPLVQKFSRCIWADAFHTESFADSYVIGDLIARLAAIAALSDDERRALREPAVRNAAFPIDLMPLAHHYEIDSMLRSQWQDEDDRVRYYGFWTLFRAAGIRGVALQRGDDSFANRSRMADTYLQLGALMLQQETEGERIVLVGDLTFAEQCAHTAYRLVGDDEPAAQLIRGRAEKLFNEVEMVRHALAMRPDRFVLHPRYGPFPVSKARR
jgi:hypothetical protein